MKTIKKVVKIYECESCGEKYNHSRSIFTCDICRKEICNSCFNSFIAGKFDKCITYNYCDDCAYLVEPQVSRIFGEIKKLK